MRVLFAGTPDVALPSLEALLASPHEVVGVLTRPDAPAGRGRRMAPSPVRARAEEAGLPVLTPRTLRDPDALAEVAALGADVAAVVAYGALLPPAALDLLPHGWVNLHFSLLPAWRGAAPVQHAVLHGDEITGATTFRITEGLDEGPVYGTLTEEIRPTDTSGDLLARLARSGAGLLVATLDGIAAGRLVAVPQAADGVSHAPRLTAEDGTFDSVSMTNPEGTPVADVLTRFLGAVPDGVDVVVDLHLAWLQAPADVDEAAVRLGERLRQLPLTGPVRRITVATSVDGGKDLRQFTFRPVPDGALAEDPLIRGVHPMVALLLGVSRLSGFDVTRLPAPDDVLLYRCQAHGNPSDQRLVAFAQVRELTVVRDHAGRASSLPQVEQVRGSCSPSSMPRSVWTTTLPPVARATPAGALNWPTQFMAP